jgi:hypothetical protein
MLWASGLAVMCAREGATRQCSSLSLLRLLVYTWLHFFLFTHVPGRERKLLLCPNNSRPHEAYHVETTTFVKTRANHSKKLSKFKKFTHVDNIMIHNFVKYLVRTRLRL